MSYRIEKNSQGNQELVIDGFENGVALSPYYGIATLRGVNNNYYPGVAYGNYKRKACTLTATTIFYAGSHSTNVGNNEGWVFSDALASPTMTNPVSKTVSDAGLIYIQDDSGQIWKQSAVNSSTFALLEGGSGRKGNGNAGIAYWNKYLVVFGDGLIEFCGDGTGDAGIISSNWNINNSSTGITKNVANFATNFVSNNNLDFTFPDYPSLRPKFQVGDEVVFTTTGTLPSPLALNTIYYIISVASTYVQVSATAGGSSVVFTDNGTGTHTITDTATSTPLGTYTNIALLGTLTPGLTTSLTISSYVNTLGVTITGVWNEPSGVYGISFPDGTIVDSTFTNGSTTVSFPQPLQYTTPSTDGEMNVIFIDTSVTNYRPYVSKADGNLYFANGRRVGRILSQNSSIRFCPGITSTYSVNYSVTEILDPNDSITDIVDLKSTAVITGQENVYTWDYISPNTSSPSPVGEPIHRAINLLNNIYIFAGQKGNIYISNGYSAQLFYKIPDYISGVIDPVFSWGDAMVHRSKLFFQLLVQDTSSNNKLAGVFSLIVSPTQNDSSPLSLIQEAQNSYGLTPSSGATSNGLLIDNNPSSTGYDSYYSAWSNGASTGGIDYNDTTLPTNWESIIETDIIPLGSILDKKTLGNIMFKLDRPMVSGDQIRFSFRPSLSDSYTSIGTTTSTQLSDYYPSNVTQSQWSQFKVEFNYGGSPSSRIPLREIRIQLI